MCGGYFPKSSARFAIYSPNYPQNYGNNMNCSYVLELERPLADSASPAANSTSDAALARVEHIVHVSVLDLQVETSGHSAPGQLNSYCPWDYLELVPAARVANVSNLLVI